MRISAALIFLFCLSTASAGIEVHAQSVGLQQPSVRFQISPEVPEPGEPMLITVEGVGSFLGESLITWKVNGKTVLSKVGASSLSLTAGPLGNKTTVDVTIDSGSRGLVTRTFTITPNKIEMLWEADTSTPLWYKGKPLYSAGSTFTVTAIPHVVLNSKVIPAQNLSFAWSQNGTPLTQKSGLGKSKLTAVGSQLLPSENISVEVRFGGSIIGSGNISLPAVKPQIFIYQKDPLRGTLFDGVLGNSVSLQASEFTAEAVPYYFSIESLKNGSVPYEWKLNGQPATGPETSRGLLTLRQSGNGGGRATLEVSAQNLNSDKFVQSATRTLQIFFGASSNSALSSFLGI